PAVSSPPPHHPLSPATATPALHPPPLHDALPISLISKAFWTLNIGLAMMVFMSLLPAGIYQAWASISEGLWYARSPEIIHSSVIDRKSTRLNSSHVKISYAVFCLKKKTKRLPRPT